MSDSHKTVLLPLHCPEGGRVNSEKGDTFVRKCFATGMTVVVQEQ